MCFKWVSNEASFYKEYSLMSHKVLLLFKREGTIKAWPWARMMVHGFTSKWRLQQVIKKCLKLAALPWNRAHSSLRFHKTSMSLVWIGQRRSRQSTECYFSCSWRCSFTLSFTHLWAFLLRMPHSYLNNTTVFRPTALYQDSSYFILCVFHRNIFE